MQWDGSQRRGQGGGRWGCGGLPGSSLAGPPGLLIVPHVPPTRGKLQGVVDPRSPGEVQGPACSAPASNPGLGGRMSQWARSPRAPQEGARWRGRHWGLADRNPKVRRSWYLSFNSLRYLNLLFFSLLPNSTCWSLSDWFGMFVTAAKVSCFMICNQHTHKNVFFLFTIWWKIHRGIDGSMILL